MTHYDLLLVWVTSNRSVIYPPLTQNLLENQASPELGVSAVKRQTRPYQRGHRPSFDIARKLLLI